MLPNPYIIMNAVLPNPYIIMNAVLPNPYITMNDVLSNKALLDILPSMFNKLPGKLY